MNPNTSVNNNTTSHRFTIIVRQYLNTNLLLRHFPSATDRTPARRLSTLARTTQLKVTLIPTGALNTLYVAFTRFFTKVQFIFILVTLNMISRTRLRQVSHRHTNRFIRHTFRTSRPRDNTQHTRIRQHRRIRQRRFMNRLRIITIVGRTTPFSRILDRVLRPQNLTSNNVPSHRRTPINYHTRLRTLRNTQPVTRHRRLLTNRHRSRQALRIRHHRRHR